MSTRIQRGRRTARPTSGGQTVLVCALVKSAVPRTVLTFGATNSCAVSSRKVKDTLTFFSPFTTVLFSF